MEACGGAHYWGRELLPQGARAILSVLIATLRALDEQIAVLDAEIVRRARADLVARRLMTIPAVGPNSYAGSTSALAKIGESG